MECRRMSAMTLSMSRISSTSYFNWRTSVLSCSTSKAQLADWASVVVQRRPRTSCGTWKLKTCLSIQAVKHSNSSNTMQEMWRVSYHRATIIWGNRASTACRRVRGKGQFARLHQLRRPRVTPSTSSFSSSSHCIPRRLTQSVGACQTTSTRRQPAHCSTLELIFSAANSTTHLICWYPTLICQ